MSSPAPTSHAVPQVAIVCNSLPPYRVHVHARVADELPQIGLWSVLTHDDADGPWPTDPPAKIRVVRFGAGEAARPLSGAAAARRDWAKGGRVIGFLKDKRVAAVVLLGYNDLTRVRIFRWCRRAGVPVFIWGDSNVLGDSAAGVRAFVKRAVLTPIISKADAILPCGSLGRRYFERYGADPARMFPFPVEPDYDLIASLPLEEIERVAAEYGLKRGRRRVIFTARMVSYKRPDLALDAFARVADERPEWDLLMVGEGEMRPALQARLPPDLRPRVTWTGFVGDQSAVSALYRNSDVMVLPSDFEPWALVVNEAAAAGLALVCSDVVGAAAELVVDGRNGFTFPAGDLDALAAALLRVTAADAVDAFKSASAGVLAEWRRRADPVDGLRRALAASGVI